MHERVDRRGFLASGAAAAAALRAGSSRSAAPDRPASTKSYREPARDVPVVEHDDGVFGVRLYCQTP